MQRAKIAAAVEGRPVKDMVMDLVETHLKELEKKCLLPKGKVESMQSVPMDWKNIESYQDDSSIYRGHRCAAWPLETSLERACKRLYDNSLEKIIKMETTLSREFRRRYHHYSTIVPRSDEPLRWLSLMQHHGAPTRLLDWTYSIYVASYFASEYATHGCAIWKINKKWLNDVAEESFQKAGRTTEIFRNRDEKIEGDFQENVLDRELREPINAVIQIGPFHLDERLTIQKGVFLYPCRAVETFEANLNAMPGASDPSNVQKLTIQHREHPQVLKMLHSMNISRATLFPGLDGFAQSLKVYHPLL